MKEKVITDEEIAKFRQHLVAAEKSAVTIKKYICDVRKLQRYTKGKTLTKDLMIQFKKDLEEKEHYKISSINSFLTAINQFYHFMKWNTLCVKTIKMQRNVFAAEDKELTMEEYQKMIFASQKQGDETTALLLQTIAGTGIRVGELSYINVECLATGMTEIYHKGKERRILLPSALQNVLKDYAHRKGITEGVLFRSRHGSPMDRREVWSRMKKSAFAAGVSAAKAFPHNLRHLFAREFYRQTRDIVRLADVLGHSNIATTRIYVQSTGREHKRQLDQMHMVVGNAYQKRPKASTEICQKSSEIYTLAQCECLLQQILQRLEVMRWEV